MGKAFGTDLDSDSGLFKVFTFAKMAEIVQTKPYAGQKPGTSGLRKKTKEFMQVPMIFLTYLRIGESFVPYTKTFIKSRARTLDSNGS